MKALNKANHPGRSEYPVKVIQFGEGNFLRAFVDWMIHKANKAIDFNSGVVVVQPLEYGMVDLLQKQDNLYHVSLQGIKDGKPAKETELIDCIMDSVNPYSNYEAYKEYFLKPELELVVSNTTEAGITRVENEDIHALPPKSFPGKVCQLLYQRFKHFNGDADKGLTFFCCELIDKNARVLNEIVLELAEQNNLEQEFIDWINNNCNFCSTLVDRIVPGFPKDNIKEIQEELGYEDNLVVVGEYFHLWAIEAPQKVREQFPFDKAGLNVVWLDDMTQFRDKKVRILNGSHTALVPVGLLSGHQTVKEAFDDKTLSKFILDMVDNEVIPNIHGETEALKKFAAEILERFFNPYIRHFLKDISLNSISKWITRDYPSLLDSLNRTGKLPEKITFSLAALIVLYKGEYNGLSFEIKDTPEYVDFIQGEWNSGKSPEEITKVIINNEKIWGVNLAEVEGLADKVAGCVKSIVEDGIKVAIEKSF
ncbi:tagaturonate reductase [Plebeiibacterium marinum]|uniref:Tagaturonate reductase n=1 Tax=Plebeiibacterium marinum TaxID=2992111 RepID=A0AAE3SK05_9BACT|nr:tagaturonate reductase [Plebeiobacterium marinum]MCW3806315.1 tagaturonate reductase [Plebeiobacterium marinum]